MKIKLLLFVISLSIYACSGDPSTSSEYPKTVEGIQTLADSVYNETTKKIDQEKAMYYVDACEAFAMANPENEQSAELLLKAAETARNVNQHDRAIKLYDIVLDKFADHKKAPQALFLKAFTYDDNMDKKEEAKVLYEEFIQKYPNDDFIESAKFMLANLYKTDAEIIQEFEKKRNEGENQTVQ